MTLSNNEYFFPNDLNTGITLRDYFAAKAMQALIEKYDENSVEISIEAYEFADEMLQARKIGIPE